RRIADESVVEPEDADRRRQGGEAHDRPGDPDRVRAEQPRREAPEDEAEDGAPAAAGEHPTPLLPDEGRLGDPSGREDRLHPREFPALDDAHERWQRGRADKDSPNSRRGAYFLRGRRSGYVCPSRIQATFSSRR